MKKNEKACSLYFFVPAMLLVLLSSVSCTPLLMGQAAFKGAMLVTTAVAASSSGGHNKNLKSAVNEFNEDFQFQDYTHALVFVSQDKREKFWSEADRFHGKINIAGYELRDIELDKKKNQATVLLHFQYWRTVSPIVKELSLKQKWQYSKKDKNWTVSDSGFEAFPSNSY